MPVRVANASWEGDLKRGSGSMRLGSGGFEGPYSHGTRFGEEPGTNPEELIGAAHAGCFSMFLSSLLSNAGYPPTRIETEAKVHLGEGPAINLIELHTEADVPGVSQETFEELAEQAKKRCPVSKALASVEIELKAILVG
ncbi:MAG: OsmC family protein [Trueperaceae bacterium]|nr:MAG: OsmC family protein [Trueperaceae bacterium]